MYTEFILIYIGIGILILAMAAAIVLLVIVLKRLSSLNRAGGATPSFHTGGYNAKPQGGFYAVQSSANGNVQQGRGGVVFCKKCATQFDASQHVCPNCGTMR